MYILKARPTIIDKKEPSKWNESICKRERVIVVYPSGSKQWFILVDQSSGWPCSVIENEQATPPLSSNLRYCSSKEHESLSDPGLRWLSRNHEPSSAIGRGAAQFYYLKIMRAWDMTLEIDAVAAVSSLSCRSLEREQSCWSETSRNHMQSCRL